MKGAQVLVAERGTSDLTRTVDVLRRAGYQATGASTFEEGKRLLAARPTDLLIADIRLGAFNGLHLLITHPELPAIVTHGLPDPVLEAEAKRHGATFLLKPATPSVLLQVVSDVLAVGVPRRSITVRHWPRKRISAGLPATIGQTPGKVLDVGYGGLRVEMPEPPVGVLPLTVEVSLPAQGLVVEATLVWTNAARLSGGFWGGAALSETRPQRSRAWEKFVDGIA